MTASGGAPGASATRARRRSIGVELAAMASVLIGLHLAFAWIAAWHESVPFNDVTSVYLGWIERAHAGEIPGVDAPFVYPPAALAPMELAHLLGGAAHYTAAWVGIVLALNLVALAALVGPGLLDPDRPDLRRRRAVAWWWLAFTALLGPIAIGRIDAITVPIAIVAVLQLRGRPAIAGALLTLGAWVKVWPAAVFAAAFVALRSRWRLVLGAAAMSAAVLVAVLALGGPGALPNALSFVTEQTGRGLQVESTAASVLLVLAAFGAPGYTIAFDREILTIQISGPGTEAVAAALTPLMFAVVLVLLALALRAGQRGTPLESLLPACALGIVAAFIAVNKVGSPQFLVWLGPVAMLAMLWQGRGAAPVGAAVLVIGGLTQLVYPWCYGAVVGATVPGALLLLVRNLLVMALLALAIVRLARGDAGLGLRGGARLG